MKTEIRDRIVFTEWLDDISFIASSWIQSFVSDSNLCKGVLKSTAHREQSKLVNRLIPCSRILAACDKDMPSLIFGYIVYSFLADGAVIHYAYVKHSYQKFGIGTALVELVRATAHKDSTNAMVSTHSTIFGMHLKKCGVTYNPYLLINGAQFNAVSQVGQASQLDSVRY